MPPPTCQHSSAIRWSKSVASWSRSSVSSSFKMMENAGHHLTQRARNRFPRGEALGKRVTVLAGSGGNGGGALVAA
jgi:NAD(P)H-hydrate repair Nnr-like enzyme with NAD(P)H-hydrate epimerase domain